MFFAYFLESINFPQRTYVGFTGDITQRLETHNTGKSVFTARYKPWKLVAYFCLDQEVNARNFERYLKTSAGRIFLKRYCNNQTISKN